MKSSLCVCVLDCALRQVDSGFFCEGYSSDEDVLVKEEFRGNIIKQGCLLKQVNRKQANHVFLLFIRCQHCVNNNHPLM